MATLEELMNEMAGMRPTRPQPRNAAPAGRPYEDAWEDQTPEYAPPPPPRREAAMAQGELALLRNENALLRNENDQLRRQLQQQQGLLERYNQMLSQGAPQAPAAAPRYLTGNRAQPQPNMYEDNPTAAQQGGPLSMEQGMQEGLRLIRQHTGRFAPAPPTGLQSPSDLITTPPVFSGDFARSLDGDAIDPNQLAMTEAAPLYEAPSMGPPVLANHAQSTQGRAAPGAPPVLARVARDPRIEEMMNAARRSPGAPAVLDPAMTPTEVPF
jgi:hypothetical protein